MGRARHGYRWLAELRDGEVRYRSASSSPARALNLYGRSMRDDDFRAMLDMGELHEARRAEERSPHRRPLRARRQA